MKYPAKIYAKALMELMLEKDTKKQVAAFLDFLAKNGDMKKAGQVIFLAENLFYERTGKRKIIIETARRIEKKNLLKDFFQEGDMVKEKINPELIAGIKVMINNNKQLDFSLKNKLDNIFT